MSHKQAKRSEERRTWRLVQALSKGQQGDDTRPLVMAGGYVHTVCGNPAEVATGYRLANCPSCGGAVPRDEVRNA